MRRNHLVLQTQGKITHVSRVKIHRVPTQCALLPTPSSQIFRNFPYLKKKKNVYNCDFFSEGLCDTEDFGNGC